MSKPLDLEQLLECAKLLAADIGSAVADGGPAWESLIPRLTALASQWAETARDAPEVKAGRGALVQVLGDAGSRAIGRTAADRMFGDAAARLRHAAKEEAAAQRTADLEAAKEADAAANEDASARRAQIAAERAAASDEALGAPPFILKGWDPARKAINYQHRDTGQLGSIPAPTGSGSSGLLSLAPLEWWERAYSIPGDKPGVRWLDAASSVTQWANDCPVFRPGSVRGRGVWLDAERVVWNLGDRLLVDGAAQRLVELQSEHTYALAQPLPSIERGPELTDQKGVAVVAALEAMGWEEPLAHLLLAGWAVTASVGGALVHRPGVQLTAGAGSGKTTAAERGVLPLLGGLVELQSEVTEAAVRQRAKGDALPVLIDESEQGDGHGRARAGHLRLLRCSFDGRPGGRGTVHGEPLEQKIRYSILLAGINATIPSPADRSRVAIVTRRHLPAEEWQQVEQALAAAVTADVGRALIRRTVAHLRTLRANARTLARAIEAAGDTSRAGDCYGALLAGALLLTSIATLTPESAAAWLEEIGWTGALAQSDEEQADEGRQCLERILAHRVRWTGDSFPSGEITLGELAVAVMEGGAGAGHSSVAIPEAVNALGRSGLRVLTGAENVGGALAFANNAPGLLAILERTPWANGGHRQRLLGLPGASTTGKASKLRFPTDPTPRRAVVVPWEVIRGSREQQVAAVVAG
jgi:hypothetical protein